MRRTSDHGAGASADAKQDAGVHPEDPVANDNPDKVRNDDGREPGDDERKATRPQASYKIRPSGEADHRDEPGEPQGFKDP